MANMNLFEKYGIKEVADVTFYRIEKKDEVYESQREISAATILKGALELQMVYPMNNDGEGSEDGFEAYVFTDAQIVTNPEAAHSHEYDYEKQVLNLFAKNQNLIAKTGTRYEFTEEGIFEDKFEFSHDFAVAPNSTERIVVVGLTNALSDGLYSTEEVNATIKALTYTIKAKAYDVVYKDYSELIVADEMGYFDPTQIGTGANRETGKITGAQTDVTDTIIKNVTMWNADTCKSINDAILALRQKKDVLDVAKSTALAGLSGVEGGYKIGKKRLFIVTGKQIGRAHV